MSSLTPYDFKYSKFFPYTYTYVIVNCKKEVEFSFSDRLSYLNIISTANFLDTDYYIAYMVTTNHMIKG